MSAYAHMHEGMKPEHQRQMDREGKMPMMQMCQEGHKEMMQMMMEMMQMQKKMIKGMKILEKREMMMEMDRMMEKMDKMMSMPMGMMGGMPPHAKMKCAEEWLKKAIDLHEMHIKDPKTATEASQMEMMKQMKKAYECITKGTQPEGNGDKGKEETETQEEHKH